MGSKLITSESLKEKKLQQHHREYESSAGDHSQH
jgi:hypothetical protein